MASDLGDPPIVHHGDPVGAHGRGEAVRHDHGGPSLEYGVQRPLHLGLRAQIQIGGGLVEDEHARSGQEGAGEGQQLALTRRQRGAALVTGSIQAVGERRHERLQAHDPAGFGHLGVTGVGAGEADVVADGAVEQEGLLGHNAELPSQRLQLHGAQIHPVDPHRALAGVVEAHRQLGDRGLAGSGGPDDGEAPARGDVEVDVPQHQLAAVVGERHPLEADPALDGAERHGAGCLLHVGPPGEQLPQLGGGGLALLVGVVEHHELADGGEERRQVEGEGGEGAEREAAVDHQPAAHAQHDRLADDADSLGRGAVERRHLGGVDVGVLVLAHHDLVLGDVAAPAVVGGDGADAGQVLRQVGQDGGDPVPHPVVARLRGAPEPQRQQQRDRHHDAHRQRRQGHVQVEQDAGDDRQGQPLHDHHH